MDKRGQYSDMLLLVVKIVFAALTILILINISAKVVDIFMSKDKSPQISDMERVAQEIMHLFENEKLVVPVHSSGYTLRLIDKENPALPSSCKGKSCICLYKESSLDTCKAFDTFASSAKPEECTRTDSKDSRCVKESEADILHTNKFVILESKSNIITIGAG